MENMDYSKLRTTPDIVGQLGEDDILVFACDGSRAESPDPNVRLAYSRYGANPEQNEGPSGRTYAIPVLPGGAAAMKPGIDRFIDLADEWDQNTFYVTRIGCDPGPYTTADIAPMFRRALALYNIRLPAEFLEILTAQ